MSFQGITLTKAQIKTFALHEPHCYLLQFDANNLHFKCSKFKVFNKIMSLITQCIVLQFDAN